MNCQNDCSVAFSAGDDVVAFSCCVASIVDCCVSFCSGFMLTSVTTETTKDSASTTKASPICSKLMTRPARPGPTRLENSKKEEVSALPLCRSSPGRISGMMAKNAGKNKPEQAPKQNAM